MNKALEQKLIGPLEESHTKEQSPKQFYERCFEQRDRKSQQNELELVLELDGDFFGRKKKCVGAGISGGEPPWAHEARARPGGWPRPGPSCPGACSPVVFSVPDILKYSRKNHIKLAGHLENFYFWGIFILHE